ncbi:hypothetical protein [Flavobacterium celericrescens]|uniref:Uncharacterized protein n=1 Tax=Flavobacterium celericrescens TaxID=2709780 RepID=A0ABX0IFK6_9FLAO|nr:hypothetical protein [Flavobacterium celericrescens]NHM04096.1 hypothetical protein [Flavobacterium celericrescens]
METEEIKEKFEAELKWGSYYFLYSIILSLAFSLFQLFILNQSRDNLYVLIFFNLLLLIYVSRKCIHEKRYIKNVTFISKLIIILKIFSINYLFISLIGLNNGDFLLPKREFEIQETEKSLNETESNLLNDLINFVKKTQQLKTQNNL